MYFCLCACVRVSVCVYGFVCAWLCVSVCAWLCVSVCAWLCVSVCVWLCECDSEVKLTLFNASLLLIPLSFPRR